MPYLIDGHNLIAKMPDISLDDPHDEAKLVQKLLGFVARTGRQCVVVFDRGLPGGASRMSTRNVTVIFAPQKSNADLVIIRRIRNEPNPKMWTVVSSDREVLAIAQHHRMQYIKSADFAEMLTIQPRPKPGPDVAEDVRVSPQEVEMWLKLFSERERQQNKNGK